MSAIALVKSLANPEAVRAARLWELKPLSFTDLPLDVPLNFSLDCRP